MTCSWFLIHTLSVKCSFYFMWCKLTVFTKLCLQTISTFVLNEVLPIYGLPHLQLLMRTAPPSHFSGCDLSLQKLLVLIILLFIDSRTSLPSPVLSIKSILRAYVLVFHSATLYVFGGRRTYRVYSVDCVLNMECRMH